MIRFEITNLPEFRKSLEKLETQIRENIDGALEKSAQEVAKKAKDRAPVKTGKLRDSVEVQKTGELNFEVQVSAPYARSVEFGTLKTPGRPFLFPAFEENRGKTRENLIKAINKSIGGER